MVSFPSSRERADVHRTSAFYRFKSHLTKNPHAPKGAWGFLAEMEGFEPPHALRRLADFESAPFSHLGTSPEQLPHYISRCMKNQVFQMQNNGWDATGEHAANLYLFFSKKEALLNSRLHLWHFHATIHTGTFCYYIRRFSQIWIFFTQICWRLNRVILS